MDQYLSTGLEIDQFLILHHIDRGGMADVYLAEDKELGRQVVLKLMLPELAANKELIARFQREAQATARLSHPHIVQIYTIGQAPGGQPYIALQYIGGGSLSAHLDRLSKKGQWISTPYALTIARQMADALATAHDAGIIHRDLKPNNILLREDGSAVLSDLGIASVQQATTRLTRTGGILGTPYYMSPEQGVGEKLDDRSDLYSLGVILYELLAKKPPFQAESPWAVVHQHVYEQPYPLEQIRPGLALDTYEIVKTCLQKDPNARYQDARALSAALLKSISIENSGWKSAPTVIDTPPLGTAGPKIELPTVQKEPRAGSKWMLLVLIPIALLLIGFGGYRWITGRTVDSTAVNDGALAGEENGEIVDPPMETDLVNPEGAPLTPMIAILPEETNTATPALPTETATSLPPTNTATAVSPTETPTTVPAQEEIEGLPGSGIVRMTSDNNSSEFAPILSPDQKELVFFSDQTGNWQIYAMNSLGGDWQRLTYNDVDNFHPHYSPDGEEIVFASEESGDFEIYTMTASGQNLQRITYRSGADEYPSFSPDGQWILYLSKRDNGWGVYAISRNGSTDRAVIDTTADETYPVFSPDGEMIVFQSNELGNHDIYTIPWNGGERKQITHDASRDANPVFSPDGQWIAFESDRSGNYEIYVIRSDGSGLQNLTNHTARDQLPAFSPDGRWLLFQSDREGSVDIFRQAFNP